MRQNKAIELLLKSKTKNARGMHLEKISKNPLKYLKKNSRAQL